MVLAQIRRCAKINRKVWYPVVTLTLTDNQAKVLSAACEFYMRMRIGQFNELIWLTMSELAVDKEFVQRRDEAEYHLLEARKQLMPDLHGAGHSYGIGKYEDADTAYDIHMVVRRLFGDLREPFSLSKEPLPVAVREEDPNGR